MIKMNIELPTIERGAPRSVFPDGKLAIAFPYRRYEGKTSSGRLFYTYKASVDNALAYDAEGNKLDAAATAEVVHTLLTASGQYNRCEVHFAKPTDEVRKLLDNERGYIVVRGDGVNFKKTAFTRKDGTKGEKCVLWVDCDLIVG